MRKSSDLTYILYICLHLGFIVSYIERVTGQFLEPVRTGTRNNTGQFPGVGQEIIRNVSTERPESGDSEINLGESRQQLTTNSRAILQTFIPWGTRKSATENLITLPDVRSAAAIPRVDSDKVDFSCYECTSGNQFLQQYCVDPFEYASQEVNLSQPCPNGTYGCAKAIVLRTDEIYYFRECMMIHPVIRLKKVKRLNYSVYFFGVCDTSNCNVGHAEKGPPQLLLWAVAVAVFKAIHVITTRFWNI